MPGTTRTASAFDHSWAQARATCWAIVDCGAQTWFFEERPRRVREIRFSFELIDETQRNGDRISIEARWARSFWPTSNMKRDIEHWLGRGLSLIERAPGGFDLASLLGRSCILELRQRGRYRAVQRVAGPYEPTYPPNRRPLFLMLEAGRFDVDAFHRLDDRLKDRIGGSPTFHALHEDTLDDASLWPAQHIREPTGSELLEGDDIPW